MRTMSPLLPPFTTKSCALIAAAAAAADAPATSTRTDATVIATMREREMGASAGEKALPHVGQLKEE